MPPFQYDRYTSPYTGSIAQLIQAGPNAEAEAIARSGQAYAGAAQAAAAGVSHAVDVATDPRRKLEAAQLKQHEMAMASAAHVAAGKADLSQIMQHAVAPGSGPGSSSTLGANDSGPQLPNFLRKEGDVSVWDTDGISKVLVAHGYADLAPEFIKDLNALNNAHRTEMKARTDAASAADDVIAHSAGLALWLQKRFGLSPIQALDGAVLQIRANGTVPEDKLDPYLTQIKSQPDQGLAILERMAAGGHQKRLELGKDTVSINQNNPNDVIANPNAGQPEQGTPAWYDLVNAGVIKPPPGFAPAAAPAAPPVVPASPVAPAPPASTPAPQGIIPPAPPYADVGTATTTPDPAILARGTPIPAPSSQVAPGAQAAASTVLPTPPPVAASAPPPAAAAPPPAASTPAGQARTPDAERIAALNKARQDRIDTEQPTQHVQFRLMSEDGKSFKDVPGSFVPKGVNGQRARYFYNGEDVTARARVIPTSSSISLTSTKEEASAIADGIESGDQPPTTAGLYRYQGPVRAELARRGFNLTLANLDWEATKRHVLTLNNSKFTNLRTSIETAYQSVDVIEDLAKQWKGGRFPALNKGNLALAKGGAYGSDVASIATQLDGQITDVTSELGNVYMGGNSPTDHALKLAEQNLKSEWDEKVLIDMIKLARTNLQIRRNSILHSTPAGLSQATDTPTYGNGNTAPKTGATSTRPPAGVPAGATITRE